MPGKNSDVISSSPNKLVNAFRGGVMKGAGYDAGNLQKRPLIAIANSHTEMTAIHNHLDRLAGKVKGGILVEGGDMIEIEILRGRIHADLTDAEIARCRVAWKPVMKEVGYGYMDRYRRHVRSASEGAILD